MRNFSSAIYDTFESEQGVQSLVFFLLALLSGCLFVYPLLHMSAGGEVVVLPRWPRIFPSQSSQLNESGSSEECLGILAVEGATETQYKHFRRRQRQWIQLGEV